MTLAPEAMPKEGVVYTDIETRPDNWLRVTAAPYRGGIKVHVREYWRPREGEEPVPTKRGIAFEPRHLRRVISALELLEEDLP